jgi:hypothetical protein
VTALLRAAALLCGAGAAISFFLVMISFPQLYASLLLGGEPPFVLSLFGFASAGLAFGFAASTLGELKKIAVAMERDHPSGTAGLGAPTGLPPAAPFPAGTRGRVEPTLRG